jgi:hypothetical protein
MALQTEVWVQDIQENLFASNKFMDLIGIDDSQYISDLKVHIPQAGANPAVKKNRNIFPAEIGLRTDVDLTYNMAQFTTDPVIVSMLDQLQISYDKRMSVMGQHIKKLGNTIANNTLYSWTPATVSAAGVTRLVTCSGAAQSRFLAPGATGNRNSLAFNDVQKAAQILGNDNIDDEERYLILPENLYWDFYGSNTTFQKMLEYGSATQESGNLPKIAGFTILRRSSVIVLSDTNGTPTAIGDDGVPLATATTDNLGALAVSKSYVRKALGNINVFSAEKRPEYYGDIFSALVMQGAAISRTNQEGVVFISQV